MTTGGDAVDAARRGIAEHEVPTDAFGRTEHGRALADGIAEVVGSRMDALDRRLRRLRDMGSQLSASADEYDRVEDEETGRVRSTDTRLDGVRDRTNARIGDALHPAADA